MAMPSTQEEIDAYKRARIEAYERQQAENAELLRQRKAAEDAKRGAASASSSEPGAGGAAVVPSQRRMDRRAKAANRKTVDPAKMEELKRLQQQQQQGGGGPRPAGPMLPADYFPNTAPPDSTEYYAGLWNCSDDSSLCCLFVCVCCFLAKSKAMADGRPCDAFDLCCVQPPCFIRKQMKAKFGIPQAPCSDCLSMLFCCPCASCQDIIEMKRRYQEANITWNCCGTSMQSDLYN